MRRFTYCAVYIYIYTSHSVKCVFIYIYIYNTCQRIASQRVTSHSFKCTYIYTLQIVRSVYKYIY